jgi:cytochrome c biogenesis protein CcmG, thiol:disulfide interchange protein DsbE
VTPQPPTRRLRRPIALLAVAAVTLVACGGGDDPVAAPEEPGTEEPVDTRPPVDGPVSTLSPDVPDSFEGGVGPVDVVGDPLPPLVSDVDDPSLGQQVPVLVGLDLDDRPIRIDPATDGPTMLVFVAHWCPHCNDEIPKLNRMRAYDQFPDALDVVAVSTAVGPDRPNWPPVEWLREDMKWKYPAMLDGIDMERESFIAAEAYGVTGFPFTVLVNGDGTVADRWSGEREPEEILARIDALGLA